MKLKKEIWYVVLKRSTDGTLHEGDHIKMLKTGELFCREAGGWLAKEHVQTSLQGAKVSCDVKAIKDQIKVLQKQLKELKKC